MTILEDVKMENANYADIRDKLLANGEHIPTLSGYLAAVKLLGDMRLILEVKESLQKGDEAYWLMQC